MNSKTIQQLCENLPVPVTEQHSVKESHQMRYGSNGCIQIKPNVDKDVGCSD